MTTVRRARKGRSEPTGPVTGPVRVDPRTKDLTKRLQAGDIAVIDHDDLDQVSAHALVACAPAAVVNAAMSTKPLASTPAAAPKLLVK